MIRKPRNMHEVSEIDASVDPNFLGTSHPEARARISVGGGHGGGHYTQIMLNDDSSGSSTSDKIGPYKTTTHITHNSAPRRPMASRQDSGSGSGGPTSAPAPPRRR